MKIAFIVSIFPKLSETFILNQITGLIDRGHDVDIFASMPGDDPTVHESVKRYNLLDCTVYQNAINKQTPRNKLLRFVNAIKLIVTNLNTKPASLLQSLNVIKFGKEAASLGLLYKIIPFLDKGPYDIVHCHFGPNGNLGILLRDVGVIKAKVLTTFHGYDVNRYPLTQGKEVYSDLFRKGDLFSVNSNFTKDQVVGLGCSEDKIVKLPVGLETSKFFFKERKLQPGKGIKILTVARLVEKKGLTYSIKAVAKILKKHPEIQYKIVGDGPLRDQLQELIKLLCVEDKVKLLGWKNQEEIDRYYAESHIFVLSSVTASDGDREGQGLVLQEAQAMGIPVISTLHNGIPDGVIDGKSGFLVPEKSIEALVERLEYLIENPERWPAIGRAGSEFVKNNYDINTLNDRLVNIYRQVIKTSSN